MSNEFGIEVDQSAIERINALRASNSVKEFGDSTMLRVAVEGGGCSGFQYKIEPAHSINDDDMVLERSIVIDNVSAEYLKNSTIKYQDDLMSAMFVVDNPNATSSCGCSASFSVDMSNL